MSAQDSVAQNVSLQSVEESPARLDRPATKDSSTFADVACVFITTSASLIAWQATPNQFSLPVLIAAALVITGFATLLFRSIGLYRLPASPLSILETERLFRGISYLIVAAGMGAGLAFSVSFLVFVIAWGTGTFSALLCLRGLMRSTEGLPRSIRTANSNTPTSIGFPQPTPAYVLAKRTLDLVTASVLLLLLSPLLFLIAVAIRLDTPGPVFFAHVRIGKFGRPFRMWKFRSMYVDVSPYKRSPTMSSDPRITRVGSVLRRLSLDELPQLMNVLSGQMSLVGPRPEMPFIVDTYSSAARRRLCVTPGITGLWQISPSRALPIHENLQYDFFYLQHRSLFLDLAIIVRTPAAIAGRGRTC